MENYGFPKNNVPWKNHLKTILSQKLSINVLHCELENMYYYGLKQIDFKPNMLQHYQAPINKHKIIKLAPVIFCAYKAPKKIVLIRYKK